MSDSNRPLAEVPYSQLYEFAPAYGEARTTDEKRARATDLTIAAVAIQNTKVGTDEFTDAALRVGEALDKLGVTPVLLDHLLEIPTPGFVRRKREAVGMSQQEAATELGVVVSTISRLETGERDNPATLKAILECVQDKEFDTEFESRQ